MSHSVSCRVLRTSQCCVSEFRLITSLLAQFLSAASVEPFFFLFPSIASLSQSIILMSHVTLDSNAKPYLSKAISLWVQGEDPNWAVYICKASRNSVLILSEKTVIWWSSTLFMSERGYGILKSPCSRSTLPGNLCVRVCVCVSVGDV